MLAAGGVVRRGDRVLLVHRPKYDDWTLPKGKLDPGERLEEAALREVEEETGFVCELGPNAGSTSYRDAKGREKHVLYWEMTPIADRGFEPNDEIDEIRWVTPEEARELLTYDHDRELV